LPYPRSAFCFALLAFTSLACKPRMRAETEGKNTTALGLEAKEIAVATPRLKGAKLAPGEKGCPKGNSQAAGCLRVEEEGSEQDSFSTTLFYKFLEPPQPERPSLVFLHGGPGGSFEAYEDLAVLTELAKTHNVLLYDQRGGGQSNPLPQKSSEAVLRKHFIAHHVADLEALRVHVLGTEKMSVVGHSFGAHLAFAYAVEFPEHVEKLVAMNGAADGSGFVMQSTLRQRMFEQAALTVLGTQRYAELQKEAEEGTLRTPDGTHIESLFAAYHPLLYTFEGQTAELPALLRSYAKGKSGAGTLLALVAGISAVPVFVSKGNIPTSARADDDIFPVIPRPRKASGSWGAAGLSLAEGGSPAPGPTVTPETNQWSVCSSLVTQKKVQEVDPLFHEIALARRRIRCAVYPPLASTFDVTSRLENIRAPTLLTGGSHDPLIPYSLQSRDFELLRMKNKQVSFIVFPDAGHNPDESPVCFERTLLAFLKGTLPVGKIDCATSARGP
jgi:pimeloyl-ACP methyl ester carboxylesterase